MNLDTIIAELKYYEEGVFPRKALKAAIANRDAITPVLLQALEDAKNDIKRLVDDPGYMLHTYAFFLLAQFRETKAYPLIIDFFSIPGDDPYTLTGDFITEDLGRVLASVCDGNLAPIKKLIETPILDESTRGAGLSAFTTLFVEEKVTREEVLDYFQHLFVTLDREKDKLWSALTLDALEFYPTDAILASVQSALDDGLVDPFWVSADDVDYFQNLGLDGCKAELKKRRQNRFVQDAISEMEWWAGFQTQEIKAVAKAPAKIPAKKLSVQEIWNLTHPEQQRESLQQGKKKSKSKKSPLREAKGFSATSTNKKSKKKRSKT